MFFLPSPSQIIGASQSHVSSVTCSDPSYFLSGTCHDAASNKMDTLYIVAGCPAIPHSPPPFPHFSKLFNHPTKLAQPAQLPWVFFLACSFEQWPILIAEYLSLQSFSEAAANGSHGQTSVVLGTTPYTVLWVLPSQVTSFSLSSTVFESKELQLSQHSLPPAGTEASLLHSDKSSVVI